MIRDISIPVAADDPVAVGLRDPVVHGKMMTAAQAFLTRRRTGLPSSQRFAEAEEVVQEAAMRAWRRRDQFDSSKEIASWLVGFLVNVVRESVKKQRNITSFDSQLALANAVDTTRSVQDILSDNSLAIDMLGKLQTQDQALVKLKYWEDLTCAEIGQRLEMKENAVRTRLWRIDKKLKQLYGVTGEGQS